jgi:hypothetical protein
VFLTLDESQRFAGASLPILLREGRKLGLGLQLASQHLDAWEDSLLESILGNVGTLVCFRVGDKDSRRLAQSLRPFTPEQLESLDRYEAVVRLQVEGGRTMPAFDIRTLPPPATSDESLIDELRVTTRARFATLSAPPSNVVRLHPALGSWEGLSDAL